MSEDIHIYIVYSTTVLPFQDPGTLEFPWDVTEVTWQGTNFILVGGAITILKNDGVRQWEGWHPIYEMENKSHAMFQTTNQLWIYHMFSHLETQDLLIEHDWNGWFCCLKLLNCLPGQVKSKFLLRSFPSRHTISVSVSNAASTTKNTFVRSGEHPWNETTVRKINKSGLNGLRVLIRVLPIKIIA